MQDDLNEIIAHLKTKLPKRGAYREITRLAGKGLSLSKVKKVFSGGSASYAVKKKTIAASVKYVKKHQLELEGLKNLIVKD